MNVLALMVFAPLSVLAFLGSFAFGMQMWLTPTEGAMFVGLGTGIGWVVFALGNLLSWLLNLPCWLAAGRPRRFGWLVAIQALAAVPTLVVLAVALIRR
jgi:hypothetical protein